MSKEGVLLVAGVLVLVTPFLGLPMSWLAILLPALGAIIITVSQIIRKQNKPHTRFVEESAAPEAVHPDGPSAIA